MSTNLNSVSSKRSWLEHVPEPVDIDNAPLTYNTGSRSLARSGLLFTLVVGFIFFVVAFAILATSSTSEKYLHVSLTKWPNLALSLSFTALVTICTEATGYVHGTTLKWGPAGEGRLKSNANLRLFSAMKGALSANGLIVANLFAISTIFSYAVSSSILLHEEYFPWEKRASTIRVSIISFLPPIVPGVTLILQSVLGLVAFHNTHVPTWSSSPLDVVSALVNHNYLKHRSKAMHAFCLKDRQLQYRPYSSFVASAVIVGTSHRTVPLIICVVWGAAVAWAVFGVIILDFTEKNGTMTGWSGVAPPMAIL
ncbi:hypothetical protein FRB96_008210 [Tulasnella sp. 330]|nr:hypothetical protein FRB96_008210 [Tulasnella sp. 330]KAG8879099.1 hypothetical protein FRB97_002014 [Tulasnella sp. 331]